MLDNFQNLGQGIKAMAKAEVPFFNHDSTGLQTKGNTYDEIKNYIYNNVSLSSTGRFIYEYFGVSTKEKDILKQSIIQETSPFFQNSIKTGVLKDKLETLSANIQQGWVLNKKSGEEYNPVDEIELLNITQNVILDYDFINEFTYNLLTTDKFLVHLEVKEDSIKFLTRPQHSYFILDDKLHMITPHEDGFLVEIETESTYDKIFVNKNKKGEWQSEELTSIKKEKSLKAFYTEVQGVDVVKDSSLELSLLYSEAFTSLQKELKVSPTNVTVDKRLAPNGQFNFYENATIGIRRPDSINVDVNDDTEISYNQMNIRASEYREALAIINRQLDNNLLADKKELGLDPTATAVNANLSEVAKKVNSIKDMLANSINDMLFDFLDIDIYLISIAPYKIDTKELNDRLDASEIEQGLDTRKNILRKRNPNWTEKQLTENYLTIEIKLGKPLTELETEEAKKLGLIKEEEVKDEKDGQEGTGELNDGHDIQDELVVQSGTEQDIDG